MEAEWLELPELRNLARNLVITRLQRGFSQSRLARECRLSQAQVSLFEAGRRLPSLDQFVRLARAFDVPLQHLLGGSDRPGENLRDLAVELRRLGAVDLWVAEATVPGAARCPEEVIALVLSGRRPDPRVVETLPALLSWNEIKPSILRAYGITTKTLYRLAWLAEVALAIDRQKGFPGGCRQEALLQFLKLIKPPLNKVVWDDLGSSNEKKAVSPIWKRWKIRYGATITDFERRAAELNSARSDTKEAVQSISRAARILFRPKLHHRRSTSAPDQVRPTAKSADSQPGSQRAASPRKKALNVHADRKKAVEATESSDKTGK